jgi:glucose/arabinose dehydrogenase/azurin
MHIQMPRGRGAGSFHFMRYRFLFALFLLVETLAYGAPPAKLELKPGDHVAIVGNVLAERLQHDGTLEALIHQAFPKHDLVFRNLGFGGDEVNGEIVRKQIAPRDNWTKKESTPIAEKQLRSEDFGTSEEWLKRVQADVILACYGFNESFAGDAGLPAFKADLRRWMVAVKAANYSGKGTPRLVLCSPLAQEKMRDPNLPDPAANLRNLQNYTAAMAEMARAEDVQFVDLFTASQAAYASAPAPLTMNGIHLTDDGYAALAPAMFLQLFASTPPVLDEKIRAAVRERNALWFSRYRTLDGYNVYGGRSRLDFGGITNQLVMQQEMAVRDAMTADREARVWALARGQDAPVDDSHLPPVTQVRSNTAARPYLSGEAALKNMRLPKGVRANLFASEEQFPELANPVQMAWDTKGRLWVCAWPTYPSPTPGDKSGDRLLIFEDTDGDGRADRCTTFLEHLNCPTGFQFYKNGVLLVQAPDLWFIEIDPATGKAGKMTRVLNGLDSADTHHTANALSLDPGGAIYLSDGVFHRSQVETAEGPVRNVDAAIYRFEPRTAKFERAVPYGFANPHGKVFDRWGNLFLTDATGNDNHFGSALSGRLDGIDAKHPPSKHFFWLNLSRPCPGTGLLSSRAWPAEYAENFLNCNVIGFQGIYRVKLTENGSGVDGTSLEPLVDYNVGADPNFRPVQVNTGPDGAVYFADWSNALIGHMQHHLRDPNRDHQHGRIYRLTYEGRTMIPPKIDGQPVDALLALLKEPEANTRERAKIELGKRETAEVMAAVDRWVATLDPADPDFAHQLTEALWVKQWHNVVDPALLQRLLRSPDFHARFAATHVLCDQRERVPNALALLRAQVLDEHPRVRLEAVRALSFFRQWEAADAALLALRQPTDHYLAYVLKETIRQLEPWWKPALAEGRPIGGGEASATEYLAASIATPELERFTNATVLQPFIVLRDDAPQGLRQAALGELAKARHTTPTAVLVEMLQGSAKLSGISAGKLGQLFLAQPAEELRLERRALAKLGGQGNAGARAALLSIAESLDMAWAEAAQSPAGLLEFLEAVPLLPSAAVRAQAESKVRSVFSALPAGVEAALAAHPGLPGRYLRIELPAPGTLALAEVEVFSRGKNIATQGKARQSSTYADAGAQRAADGRTDGRYAAGSCSHTAVRDGQPWWEVDLQAEQPIDAVVVWNRTDPDSQPRLDGYQVVLLDANRLEVFRSPSAPAPDVRARIELTRETPAALESAAIRALVSSAQDARAAFDVLAGVVTKGRQLSEAARALAQLPRAGWAKERAPEILEAVIAWARGIPPALRTEQEYVETLQVARELATLLPENGASAARKTLRDLSVSVFVVKTVREQMRYDTPRLVVEPGKPFEVIFENNDMMPHNFVVVQPGARQAVAEAAQTMPPTQLDDAGRAYVPRDPRILAATRLVSPGRRERLQIPAPAREGEYEYVCTFPGHWMIMWGKLIVTKDPDAYVAAHPLETPATSPPAAPHVHAH